MKKDVKKKAPVKPKHPRNGGNSRFVIWIAYSDKPQETRLSIPFPDDRTRELDFLKERYKKMWMSHTVKVGHIYDTMSSELLEYLSFDRKWTPAKAVAFRVVVMYKGEKPKNVMVATNQEDLMAHMEAAKAEIATGDVVNIYVNDRKSLIYYWNFRHGTYEVPEKNKVVVPLERSKFRIFLINAEDQRETFYSTETDIELAFQQILQKLEETDYSSYRVVQVYEQMQKSLLYHAKYGHKVLDVLDAYQNAILSS